MSKTGTEVLNSATQCERVELGRFHRPADLDGAGAVPGLVLIHDVFGPSEHSQELAGALAGEGFGVLEIDLYRALGDFTIDDPGAHIRSLSDPEVLTDLDAGADWLARNSTACRGRAVGVIGVCMGGTYSLLAACLSDRFKAAAPFYGILSYDEGFLAGPEGRSLEKKPTSPIEAAERLRTPTLASFGGKDTFVPDAHVDALYEGMSASGTAFEVDRYPDAGHAFLNRTRGEAYHASASQAAWARVLPFLHAELD
jgi:carboxymethylenebutenolidase